MERVDALTREVRGLRQMIAPDGEPSLSERIDHLAAVQAHSTAVVERRIAWWRAAVVIGVVVIIAITGGGVLLDLRARAELAEANRKLCPLVALLIPSPGGRQPTTQYGRDLVTQARLLYAAYGCPPKTNQGGTA